MTLEEVELRFLLETRAKYLKQLQTFALDPNCYFSPPVSDDSESSEEESESSKIHIKTELTENEYVKFEDKSDYESFSDGNIENPVKLHIKQELIDEEMDCEEENDNVMEVEYNLPISNGEIKDDDVEKTVNETEKTEQHVNNHDDITMLKTCINMVNQQCKAKDEESCCTVKSTIKRRRRSKKDILEEALKVETRKPIKIKQEPVDYELDDEDMIDGVRRELRPRKLETQMYFEPYDGTSSEEDSDFSELFEKL